jgi:thiol-disulfide isomerase/thioredoxin
MNQSIVIGPLALQASVLVALAAIALGWFAAGRAGRGRALELDPQLYVVLAAGLIGARAAYVLQHGAAYAASPLSIFDVRDGGWSAAGGFVAAASAAALLAVRKRSVLQPLAWGVATAAVVWFGAGIAAALVDTQPTRLPTLTLRALDGRQVALSEFAGRPVVVNLWATWCPPCIREMPVLAQAQQQRRDIHFVFVDQGEQADRVRAFLVGRGLALDNVLLDTGGELARRMEVRGLPTTLFFDAQGRLAGARVGELSTGALAARLEGVAPAPARAP